MSNEEIVNFIQQGQKVQENMWLLYEQNKKFIRYVIHKVYGITENDRDFDDYMQEGYIGLATAANKYDSTKAVKFLTYAEYHIKGALIRYSENSGGIVRIPVFMRSNIRKYLRYRQDYYNAFHKYPSNDEIVKELDISEKQLEAIEKSLIKLDILSINQNINGEDSDELEKFLASAENTEDCVISSVYLEELRQALDEAISILDFDTQIAIKSAFYNHYPLYKTAEILGCSKQAVYDKLERGYWKILHSKHRKKLESFLPDGVKLNEYAHSEHAELDTEDENNIFLL